MSNEIPLYSHLQNPIEAIDRIGEFFTRSGLFGCERTEQGKVLAMVCLAEHKSPVEITRTYDIVEGKLRKKALAALAEFRGRGGKHRWIKSGDEPAAKEEDRKAELELTDREGNKNVYAYSMADARLEGLVKDKSRWIKRPGNMLRARCISNGLGMLCPEIYAGEDDTAEPEAPASLDLATITPPPAEPKPANVVSIAPVVTAPPATPPAAPPAAETTIIPLRSPDSEKELAAAGLAPVQNPEPAASSAPAAAPAKDFKPGPAYEAPKGNKLPPEMVDAVKAAIGDHQSQALAWMAKEKWITEDQSFDALTVARAKRILNNKESFLRAITLI